MEDLFKTKEAVEIFEYLKKNIHAKIVAQKENLVHLAVSGGDSLSVIGYTEVACKNYSDFFSQVCFLFELGDCYKLIFKGDSDLRQLLQQQFGGMNIGLYWVIEDRSSSPFCYEGESMPTSLEVIDFINKLRQ